MKGLLISLLAAAAGLACLPLAGLALKGEALRQYLEFPPITRYVPHAGFSLPIFCLLSLVFLGTFFLIALAVKTGRKKNIVFKRPASAHFPWWGWVGLALTKFGWILAWTRFQWMASMQYYTFLPLWVGYILIVNGLCIRRTGRCLLTDAPGRFALLFPASAVFWWFFEYLNRFVQNWYYIHVEHFSPGGYILFATASFSTVLPAVLSTSYLLQSFPVFRHGLRELLPVPIKSPRRWAGAVLVISATGLALIGVLPDLLFPLLWVSPLLVIVSLQTLTGKETIFSPLSRGDWRRVLAPALAALICGFFWELWNWGSLARWQYAIPYVQCLKIFEMPLLGYLGYLPFGLECAVVGRKIVHSS